MRSVKYGMCRVCAVESVECKVWGGEWRVQSVKCGV